MANFKSTIIVSPRERFSSIIPSLKSLFQTIPQDQPVIVVEGATPRKIRRKLKTLNGKRKFEHVALDYMVTPNESRNIGARMAITEFLVLADNDIEYEQDWLTALESNAVNNHSDAVGPLIFIGPRPQKTIHHAGGKLLVTNSNGKIVVKEAHRFMDSIYDDVAELLPEQAPVDNDVCEFHCMLMRKSFWESMGGLDERLITREQMDFGLRAKAAGAKVTFERKAHVTYRAFDPFKSGDLKYHLFRWSDHRAVESMDAFEKTWNINLERDRIRYDWIGNHRARAVSTANPFLKRMSFTNPLFKKFFVKPLEKRIAKQEKISRQGKAPKPTIPVQPVFNDVESLLNRAA